MLNARQRALQSLSALAIGDAFGELFFTIPPHALVGAAELPPGPWPWTDDTHMALSVVECLFADGQIDPSKLAARFAERFAEEPWRGYAGGAKHLLTRVAAGEDWERIARGLFDGTGSYGNGAAMRVAPLGAYFADDLPQAIEQATRSAEVTHAHPEGIAGAIAVAVAAAHRWQTPTATGTDFIDLVAAATPPSRTRDRLHNALTIPSTAFQRAASALGTGDDVAAWDTVPFCIWMTAHHRANFEFTIRATAGGMGDRDTTCAIVAGILAPEVGEVPELWREATEPVPAIGDVVYLRGGGG